MNKKSLWIAQAVFLLCSCGQSDSGHPEFRPSVFVMTPGGNPDGIARSFAVVVEETTEINACQASMNVMDG